jgi:hypothetical protein
VVPQSRVVAPSAGVLPEGPGADVIVGSTVQQVVELRVEMEAEQGVDQTVRHAFGLAIVLLVDGLFQPKISTQIAPQLPSRVAPEVVRMLVDSCTSMKGTQVLGLVIGSAEEMAEELGDSEG